MKRYKTNNFRYSTRRLPRKNRTNFLITILVGGLVLYILFAWFLPTLIGGLSFLNKFKPTQQASPPIADNATLAPPVLNIPYEATNSASISIKGYSVPNSKVEIYIDEELQVTTETKDDGGFTAEGINLSLGTNNISGKTIDSKGNKSLPSKTIKIQYANEKPQLDITAPSDNQVIQGNKKIQVAGVTNTDTSISVTINGNLAIVDNTGNFSQTLELNDGANTIVIVATDTAGNTTQVTRQVTFQP